MTTQAHHAELLTSDQVGAGLLRRSQQRDGFQDEYPFASHWFSVDGQVQHYLDQGQGADAADGPRKPDLEFCMAATGK